MTWHRCRGVLSKEIGRGGRNERDTELLQEVMARKLHCQVAGEAIGAFDDDAADAIGRNAVEHGLKPGRWAIGSAPLTAAS